VTGTTPVLNADAERDLVNRYCVGCHSERAKAAGMDSARKISLDSVDLTNVHPHAEKLELVVRKLRAGMMPPAGARRPEPAVYKAMTAWLENELDRTATPYTAARPPSPEPTEYANAVRDLLDRDIDPAKYLPSDDSTHGFDNIAGTLGISSTLVEAYVSAAGNISRLAVGEATPPTLVVYRTPEDSSQDYHIEGLPFGTRGGMLVSHEFPSDGEYTITVTPIFGDNMSPTGFGSVPCERLEVILDGERLELLDWQGGGRFGVPTPNCGPGRGAAAAGPAPAPVRGAGRPAAPKMIVRFKTTAGPHAVGVTFPQTNFAPLLDLDQHFQRDTLQTGPTPGFTFFLMSERRIEGPSTQTDAKDSPSRRKVFVVVRRAPPRNGVRPPHRLEARHSRLSPAGLDGRRGSADDVLRRRPQGRWLRRRHRDGAGPRADVAQVHLPHRNRAGQREVEHALPDLRSGSGVPPVVLPVEHRPRRSAHHAREPGPPQGPGGARAPGPPHAQGPTG
jgi:hypothetical protein